MTVIGGSATSYDGGLLDLVDGSGFGEVDPTRVRNEAAASIAIGSPNIDTNPSFRGRYAIVRFPTWLWVTDPWVAAIGAGLELGLGGSAYLLIAAVAMTLTLPVGVHLLFRAVHRTTPGDHFVVDELTASRPRG